MSRFLVVFFLYIGGTVWIRWVFFSSYYNFSFSRGCKGWRKVWVDWNLFVFLLWGFIIFVFELNMISYVVGV